MLAIDMALKANKTLPNILGIECSSSLMAVSKEVRTAAQSSYHTLVARAQRNHTYFVDRE